MYFQPECHSSLLAIIFESYLVLKCQCVANSTSLRASSSSSCPLAVGSHSTTSTACIRTSPILDSNQIQSFDFDVSSLQWSSTCVYLHTKKAQSFPSSNSSYCQGTLDILQKQQIRLTLAGCKSTAWRHITTKGRSIINHTLGIQVLGSSPLEGLSL